MITIIYIWGMVIACGIAIGNEKDASHFWIKAVSVIFTSFLSWVAVGISIGRILNK